MAIAEWSGFAQVACDGGDFICAVGTNRGNVACEGIDAFGPLRPPTGSYSQVTTGWVSACALHTDGRAVCWGDNSEGQSSPPVGSFKQLDAGNYHVCGVRADGSLVCWGYNGDGQASPPGGEFTQVTAGSHGLGAVPIIMR